MTHAHQKFMVMRLLLMRRTLGTTTVHGKLLSDGSKRHFHKMNTEVKLLRRGASVQQLGCTSTVLLSNTMEDFDVSFAETFTTLSSRRQQKKLEDIREDSGRNDGGSGDPPSKPPLDVSALTTTVKEIFQLKNKNTSSLSVERLVKKFCLEYENLEEADKKTVLIHLASTYNIKGSDLKAKAQEVYEASDDILLKKKEEELRAVLEPSYNWLYTKVSQVTKEGVKFLCDVRADLLYILSHDKNLSNDERVQLRAMSSHLKELLSHWFSAGFLELEQVTWQSPCSMLQKISDYEAVHPVKNWTDLKSRVGPYRRCFVFTHRSMPDEPIVVLHVALTTEISPSIANVVKHHRQIKKATSIEIEDLDPMGPPVKGSAGTEDPALCTTAIFYSITSTQSGLQGIELGNSLIKQAVKKLKDEFSNMGQFSTLSPIPGFRKWLLQTLQMSRNGSLSYEVLTKEEKAKISRTFYGPTDDFYDSLCTAIKSNQWAQNDKLRDALELPLMRLCAKYLFSEKRRNFALDPVANFHLRNGATMWRLNWWADLSPRGLTNSCGIMVNYRYYLDQLERNSAQYQEQKIIEATDQIKVLASQCLQKKAEDTNAKL